MKQIKECHTQKPGRILIIDESFATYSTRSFKRKEAPLIIGGTLCACIILAVIHILLGLIALIITVCIL